MIKSSDVADFRDEADGRHKRDAAQRLQRVHDRRPAPRGGELPQLVGETVDTRGRRAFVTTLRAREQDIRREKATSNVCTNQTLMAVTAAIQLGWLGTTGLAAVALACARATRYLREALLTVPGVRPLATAPVVREFAIGAAVSGELIVDRLLDEGYLAGVPIGPGFEGTSYEGVLLVAASELRTRAEIDAFVEAFSKAAR